MFILPIRTSFFKPRSYIKQTRASEAQTHPEQICECTVTAPVAGRTEKSLGENV